MSQQLGAQKFQILGCRTKQQTWNEHVSIQQSTTIILHSGKSVISQARDTTQNARQIKMINYALRMVKYENTAFGQHWQ